jgi:hypothetical protein
LKEPNYNFVKTIEKNSNDDVESNFINLNPIQYINAADFNNTYLVFDFTYGVNDSSFINSNNTYLRLYSQENKFIANLSPYDYLNERPLTRNISTANPFLFEDEHLTIFSDSYLQNEKRLSMVKLSDIIESKTLNVLYLTLRIVINNTSRNFPFSIFLDKTDKSLYAYELENFNSRIVPKIRRSNLEYGWWNSESQKDGNQLNSIVNGVGFPNGPLFNTTLNSKSSSIILGFMDKLNDTHNRKINRFTCEFTNLQGINEPCQISLYFTEDNPSYLRRIDNNTFHSVRWLRINQEGIYRFRAFEFSEYNNASYNPTTYTINLIRTKASLQIKNSLENITDGSTSLRFISLFGYHSIGGVLNVIFNSSTISVPLSLDNSRQLNYEFTQNGSYQVSFLDSAGNEGLLNGRSTLRFNLNVPDPTSIRLRDFLGNNLLNRSIVNTSVIIDFYANVNGTLTVRNTNSSEVTNKIVNAGQNQEVIDKNGNYEISFLDIAGKSGFFSDNSNLFSISIEIPPLIQATINDEEGNGILNNQIVYSTAFIFFVSDFPSTINIYRNNIATPFDSQIIPAGGMTSPYSFFALGNINVEIIDIAGQKAVINNDSNSLSFEMFTPFIGALNVVETLYNRPLDDENNISYQDILITYNANSATTITLTKNDGLPIEHPYPSGEVNLLISENGNYLLKISKIDGKLMNFSSGKNYFEFQILDAQSPLITLQSQSSIIDTPNSSIPSEVYISYFSLIGSIIYINLNGVLTKYPQSSGNVSFSLSSIGTYEISVKDDLDNDGIFENGSSIFGLEIITSPISELTKLPILDWFSFDNQSFINLQDAFDYIKTTPRFVFRSGSTNLDSIKSNITIVDNTINSKPLFESFSFVSVYWIFNERTYLHTTESGLFEFLRTEILKESEEVNFFTNGSNINFSTTENYYVAKGFDLYRFKNAKITLNRIDLNGQFQSILNEQVLSDEYFLDDGFYHLSIRFLSDIIFDFQIKIFIKYKNLFYNI